MEIFLIFKAVEEDYETRTAGMGPPSGTTVTDAER